MKAALVLAAALLLGALFWLVVRGSGPRVPSGATPAPAAPPAPPAAREPSPTPEAGRTAAPAAPELAPADPARAAAAAPRCSLEVELAADTPLEARLELMRAGHVEQGRMARAPGAEAFPDLAPGELVVRFRGPAVYPAEARVALHDAEPVRVRLEARPRRLVPVRAVTPGGAALSDVLPPGPSSIVRDRPEVHVTDRSAGDRLERVPAWFWDVRDAGELRPRTSADEAQGTLGRLWLDRAPAWVSLSLGPTLLESRAVTGAEQEVVFVVDPDELAGLLGSLSFRAVDEATGEPITGNGGGFALTAPDHTGAVLFLQLGADGRGRLASIPTGDYALVVQSGGARIRLPVHLRPGENDLGDVRVGGGTTLAGHVVDEAGEPVDARPIARVPGDPRASVGASGDPGGERGAFVLGYLPRGEVLLFVQQPGWALEPTRVAADQALVRDVRVVVRPGTQVTLAFPDAAAAFSWELSRADGTLVWWGEAPPTTTVHLTLAPGSYAATLSPPGGAPSKISFRVGSDALVVPLGGR